MKKGFKILYNGTWEPVTIFYAQGILKCSRPHISHINSNDIMVVVYGRTWL